MEFRMKKRFEALGLRWSRTRERGATAVVIALCLTLLMAAAAMSFDTANLALQRQTLANIIDASAQAGASSLPDPVAAKAAAEQYAALNDPTLTPSRLTITFMCVVGSIVTGGVPTINYTQIPSTCYPGTPAPYTTGVTCNQTICAIPCNLTGATNANCNTMKVSANKTVPFYFAPAIGIPNGNTGALTSVSCKGSCGSGTPNPLDVAILADRTPSMSNSDFSAMKLGIEGSLATMTPEYQLATVGTIHRSNATATDPCKTSLGPQATTVTTTTGSGRHTVTTTTYQDGGARVGKWMPLALGLTSGFSNTYLNGHLGDPGRTLNTTSGLGYQVDCMNHYDATAMMNGSTGNSNYPWGTHLAAPLKAAARLLLGSDQSNLGTLSATRQTLLTSGSTVKKWIIFETDGYPEETMGLNSPPYKDSTGGTNNTDLGSNIEPSAPGNTTQGCQNLLDVASHAKTAGINIIMIAFGTGTTNSCGGGLGSVRDVMALAASNADSGLASKNPSSCSGANTDGDYFFCAATGADLQNIFKTAIGKASSGKTKFVKI